MTTEKLQNNKVAPRISFLSTWNDIKLQNSYKILQGLLKKGGTLRSVGKEHGYSGEHVRQLKYSAAVRTGLLAVTHLPFLRELADKEGFFTAKDISPLFANDEDAHLFILLLFESKSPEFYYFKKQKTMLIIIEYEKSFREITETLKPLIPDLPKVLKIREKEGKKKLKELGLGFLPPSFFEKFLKENKFYSLGKCLARTNQPPEFLKHVVREHFPTGVYIYQHDDLEKVRFHLENDLGFIDKCNDYALTAKVRARTILYDKGKYISPEYIEITDDLLEEIKNVIIEQENVHLPTLFEQFEEKLRESSNIDNKYFLQGVLRYHFSDIFANDRLRMWLRQENSAKAS